MFVELGLALISAGWIVQIIKMKKNEFNKYALLLYVLGAATLTINGFTDGVITNLDWMEGLTLLTSGIVLYKLLKLKK
ncbi:MAG: hypothetical protein PHT91_00125 [Candidatus Nanoarchaeia archaeon]|nr:hypothetical protein [Candidatus Nanoarchaeia archaeon]MDD5054131.1 hypothetical protein [Candidatus Nanoarchaeia archaeon]MDD5499268.1 hypothetical protein [Candidatus Nanoarchaeia archaeon]